MNIFIASEAKHYCGGFNKNINTTNISLKDYLTAVSGNKRYHEGSMEFNEYRDCLLREVERLLFLTSVQYKRAHDLLLDSSCAWAYVTMYYGSYYAALALLAMFGGWVDIGYNRSIIVSVQNGTPMHQEIILRKDKAYANQLSTISGTHRKFWDLFYTAIASIIPSLPQPNSWEVGLKPILNNRTWLIDKRNSINYDSLRSINMMCDFQANFVKKKYASSLPGELKIQYQVMVSLTETTFYFAKLFNIRTDALDRFMPSGRRKKKIIEKVITAKDIKLLSKSKICKIIC